MPDETDKLQLSASALELLLDHFRIFSRFSGLIYMQMGPGQELEYDKQTRKLARVQYIYSAVIRSLGASANAKDPTKRVLDWRRLIVWTSRDILSGVTTMVVLRSPAANPGLFMKAMGDGAQGQRRLLRYPMAAHTFIAEDQLLRQNIFSWKFANPMYGLVSSCACCRPNSANVL